MGEADPPSPRLRRAWVALRGTEISKALWPVATQGFSETRRPEMVAGKGAFFFKGMRRIDLLPDGSVWAGWNSST